MESPYDGYKWSEIGAGEMVFVAVIFSDEDHLRNAGRILGSMRPFSVSVSLGSLGLIATKKKHEVH